MANLIKWISEEAKGETVQGVVIGNMGWGEYGANRVNKYSEQPKGKVLTWGEAQEWIDYEFDEGFGAPGCNAIYAWTETKVMFIVQYDGSTDLYSVPRNPIDTMPDMPGG